MLARMITVLIVVGACGPSEFGVASVAAVNSGTLEVVYSDIPDRSGAENAENYSIPGLTVKSASSASDGTVTLVTETQTNASYTLTVANVTRASDAQPLATATATFVGKPTFNVESSAPVDATTFTVTFDAAPDPTQAIDRKNYVVAWGSEQVLSLTSAKLTLDGNTVTFSNTPGQNGTYYGVRVRNVTRASDGEGLTKDVTTFLGIANFYAVSVGSRGVFTVSVKFSDAPETISATTLANYTIPGLTFSGTPTLSGMEVTLTSSAQDDVNYTLTIANLTRASDGRKLCSSCTTSLHFIGMSHCTDSAVDGDETDVDCGGSSCPKCASGKTCLVSTDCVSGTCNGGPPGTCM